MQTRIKLLVLIILLLNNSFCNGLRIYYIQRNYLRKNVMKTNIEKIENYTLDTKTIDTNTINTSNENKRPEKNLEQTSILEKIKDIENDNEIEVIDIYTDNDIEKNNDASEGYYLRGNFYNY